MAKEYPKDNSGGLFDYLKIKLRCRTDGELAGEIGTKNSVVSEIRHGKREVNDALLIRICNVSGISLKKAQALIAHKEDAK
jgi:transcriptional regulator with XRE-family HTH domain